MSIRARSTTPVTPARTRKVAAATGTETSITSVTVGRSFTIPGSGEFESQKVSVLVSAPSYEAASTAVDEFMVTEFEKSSAQFAQFRDASDALAEEIGTEDEEETEEEAEEGEEEIDEDAIRAMKRPALIKLIKDQELEVDPAEHKKLPALVEAVIEALSGEEEESEEEDEEAEEEEAEDEELDEDEIRGMTRKQLIALNKEYDAGLDATDYAATKKGTGLFAEALIAALSEDEEEAEEEESEEEEEESSEGYTRAELEAMKLPSLQAIYKAWQIKDKFPTGSTAIAKKKAVNRIMQFQDTSK